MKFFRHIFSKNTYSLLYLSKEVILALIVIIFPIFYPSIAHAGVKSFFFSMTGNQAIAKTTEIADVPNSQNMQLLKAVVNVNPNPTLATNDQVMISGDALSADVGPSGTVYDIDEPINTQISIYVVRAGDNLSQIAKMFGVSVNTILWANNLSKNSAMTAGQTLVILPITGIKHVVRKGDTIKSIVAFYKANLDEVLQYNDLTPNSTLTVGQTVMVPDAEPSVKVSVSGYASSAYAKNPTEPIRNTNVPAAAPGYYARPVDGQFGKSQGIHGNNAVDIAGPVGTSIHAAAGGTVIASMTNDSWNGGYGNYVIISHSNGTQTLYAHAQVVLVKVGQVVGKGDLIARIGMTGKTTGPHVHFEIRGARNPF